MQRWFFQWSIRRLEGQFLLVSTCVLGLVGLMLYAVLASAMTGQALRSAAEEANSDNAVISGFFVDLPPGGNLSPAMVTAVDQVLGMQSKGRFAVAKVWAPDGRILYATQHELIGSRFDLKGNHELNDALSGEMEAELSDLDKAENQGEPELGFKHLLEVYTPLRNHSGEIVGAFEVYRDGTQLVHQLLQLRLLLGGGLSIGLMAVWLALYGFIHRAGRALRQEHEAIVSLERQLEVTLRGSLSALSEAVEAKDDYTAGHVERVAKYAVVVADAMGIAGESRREIEYAAILHDVGKLSIPDAILLKPDRLTAEERKVIEGHAAKGEHILRQVPSLDRVAAIVRHHHERWDGQGYPDRLAGEAIPLGARIIAVVDTYDAMTTDRPYRRAQSPDEALAELRRMSGSQFDPRVVQAFTALIARKVPASA